jgi:hypothetical protein
LMAFEVTGAELTYYHAREVSLTKGHCLLKV